MASVREKAKRNRIVSKVRLNAENTFYIGDIVSWPESGLPGRKRYFVGEYRGLQPLNTGDTYNQPTHAQILILESPSTYIPVGEILSVDVRNLKIVKRGFPGSISAMAKKQAIQNVFTKLTRKNAYSKGASSVNAVHRMLGLNNIRRRINPNAFTEVVPGGNRENPLRKPVKITKEYDNSLKNGSRWTKVQKNNNPLSRIGNVFNAEEYAPNSRAVGGAGSSRKIRKSRKSKTRRGTRRNSK